jgi:hypothetical protein
MNTVTAAGNLLLCTQLSRYSCSVEACSHYSQLGSHCDYSQLGSHCHYSQLGSHCLSDNDSWHPKCTLAPWQRPTSSITSAVMGGRLHWGEGRGSGGARYMLPRPWPSLAFVGGKPGNKAGLASQALTQLSRLFVGEKPGNKAGISLIPRPLTLMRGLGTRLGWHIQS